MGKGTDNLRYREMQVKDGVFLPECDVEYPENNPNEHIVEVQYTGKQIALDDTYPYLDDSFHYKLRNGLLYTALPVAFLINRLRYGFRMEGRSELRKYRKLFKNGAMTVCNHVFRWDMICVLSAMRHRRMWFPIYGQHIMGKDAFFMRYIGGIPVPETRSGMRPFNEAFDELHRRGEWLHVFPESCSWKNYVPIRPFHKGAFTMAYKYNIPVIPCAISYRERKGLFKLFDKADVPLITLHVGTPVIPDLSKPKKDEVDRMLKESHAQMVKMAGIVKNPWPAIYDVIP